MLEEIFNNGSFPLEKVREFHKLLSYGYLESAYLIIHEYDSGITYHEMTRELVKHSADWVEDYITAEEERRSERK